MLDGHLLFLPCDLEMGQRSRIKPGLSTYFPHITWNICYLLPLPGVDFRKGLSLVSGSNLRLLSQIIVIFFLSPWAQPLWILQKVPVSALAEPLAHMLRLVESGFKSRPNFTTCFNWNSNTKFFNLKGTFWAGTDSQILSKKSVYV